MRDGASYPKNTALAILLGGNPGAGKSNLMFEWPDIWVADCDQNLKNAIERHPGKRWWYDCPEFDLDASGNVSKRYEEHERWGRLEALIKENAPRPEVKAIGVDGLGRVTDYLRSYLVHVGGQAEKPLMVGGMKVMTMSLWGPYADLLKKLVFLCRSYNKPFILTCHFKVDENELTTVKEQKVNLQGQLTADFPKLFTDFWQCSAVPSTDAKYAKANGVRYFVRTAPTHRIELKQSCGLPAEFEPGDDAFKKLLTTLSGT